jgi:hypothetical protein
MIQMVTGSPDTEYIQTNISGTKIFAINTAGCYTTALDVYVSEAYIPRETCSFHGDKNSSNGLLNSGSL